MNTIMQAQSQLFADYPASHSMDTTWYAVDENGEIGQFSSGQDNDVPVLEGMADETEIQGSTTIKEKTNFFVEGLFDGIGVEVQNAAKQRMRRLGISEKNIEYWYYNNDTDWEGETSLDLNQLPFNFHLYDSPDYGRGFYHWVASPERPMTIQDVPEYLRNGRHFLFLKDFAFKSRDLIDIYDFAPNGFSRGEYRLTPGSINRYHDERVPLPLPSRRNTWDENDIDTELYTHSNVFFGPEFFFAMDDDGCLAVFRTSGKGARPWRPAAEDEKKEKNKTEAEFWQTMRSMATAPPGQSILPRPIRFELPPDDQAIDPSQVNTDWNWLGSPPLLVLAEHGCPREGYGRFKIRIAEGELFLTVLDQYSQPEPPEPYIRRIWPTGWMRHWFEFLFEFGLAAPRRFGFYHYDMSWHHALPYARIGVPDEPARLEEFAPEWREKIAPSRLRGLRFADAPLVQPFEHAAVRMVADSEIWIDETLTRVHRCTPESILYDDEERLLRRARRYVTMVNELWRKG